MRIKTDENTPETAGEILFKRIVKNRRHLHKNTFIAIAGEGGGGKSTLGLRMAEIIQPDFSPEKQIVYTPADFLRVIRDAKTEGYKVVMLDEAHTTVDARLYYSFMNRCITYVTSTFRAVHNIVLIIVAPNINWVEKKIREQINFYCVAYSNMGGDTSDDRCYHVRMYEVGFNFYDLRDQNPFIRTIRFVYNGETKELGEFQPKLASQRILDEYERKSIEYKGRLIEKQLVDVTTMLEGEAKMKDVNLDDIADRVVKDKRILKVVMRNKKGVPSVNHSKLKNLFKVTDIDAIELEDKILKRADKGIYGDLPV